MRKIIKILMPGIILVSLTHAQDAKEIVAKANELIRANSSYAEISMSIIKPTWSRDMKMKVWSLEPEYALILITEPAKEKGMVTLKRKKEVWNWVPNVNRVIKIPPSMMMQSWMGSDFTNDDLVRQSSIVEDYTHAIIGEEEVDGYECYKIELIPKPEAGVVWGKIITWISKKGYFQSVSRLLSSNDRRKFLTNFIKDIERINRLYDSIILNLNIMMFAFLKNYFQNIKSLHVLYRLIFILSHQAKGLTHLVTPYCRFLHP